jgi:hypothetical protein
MQHVFLSFSPVLFSCRGLPCLFKVTLKMFVFFTRLPSVVDPDPGKPEAPPPRNKKEEEKVMV